MTLISLNWLQKSPTLVNSKGNNNMLFTMFTNFHLIVTELLGGTLWQSSTSHRADPQLASQFTAHGTWPIGSCNSHGRITPAAWETPSLGQRVLNLRPLAMYVRSLPSQTGPTLRSLHARKQHPRDINHGFRLITLRIPPQLALAS
jgi:hypothetical protein